MQHRGSSDLRATADSHCAAQGSRNEMEMSRQRSCRDVLFNLACEVAGEGQTSRYFCTRHLRIRKDGKALNRGHALMHMLTWKYIIIAHTKASIEGIPPKHIKNRHNMETNEQTDHKNTRNTTQDRKSENKKRSEARRIITLQYE